MQSISLITTWSGPLPRYLPLFLGTAAGNPSITFIFVADSPPPDGLPQNIRWVEKGFPELMQAIGAKLGVDLSTAAPYKMCDLKPTFGVALEDLIGGSDFWGHIDCDLILGDLRSWFTEDLLSRHDVLTLRGWGFIHGPLTLYRNTESVNRLFERALGWRETLTQPRCMGFDETGGWWARKGEVRPAGAPDSITDIVLREAATGTIRWYDSSHIDESAPHRKMRFEWTRRNAMARLVDQTGRQLAFYHLLSAKLDPAFRAPQWLPDSFPDAFTVTQAGARTTSEPSLLLDSAWLARRAGYFVKRQALRVAGRLQREATRYRSTRAIGLIAVNSGGPPQQ